MTTTEFQTLLQGQDYDFLRTNKHLGKNILFLTLGGSHAYSTLDCAEEVADVMEALCAIGKVCAVSKQDIEQVRSRGKDFF